MKIKKIEQKPMTIHRKKEGSVYRKRNLRAKKHLRIKRNIRVNRNQYRRIVLSHGPVVKRIIVSKDFVNTYKTRSKFQERSHRVTKDGKILHRGKRNNRGQMSKDDVNSEKQKSSGNHSSSGIRTLGMVGVKGTLNQLEGGEELRDSAVIASLVIRPVVGTIEKGQDLYRSQSQKQKLQRKIKRVDVDSRVGKREINSSGKKVIPQTSYKATKVSVKLGSGIRSAITGAGAGSDKNDSTRVVMKRVTGKTIGKTTGKALKKAA
ncbi:MAG: hypothetical protein ACYDEX_25135 [Mobilitalea sp.]